MSGRKIFAAGNWKMNKTIAEAEVFAEKFRSIPVRDDVRVGFMVPFPQIPAMIRAFAGTPVEIGAQNVHQELSGAYTGEVSLPMLKELGVNCCIIGHSERRAYFNETDDTVNQKLRLLLKESDITPILCVGEKLDEREEGKARTIVSDQIEHDFEDIPKDLAVRTVVAYEPVWAIGTGKTATAEQAEEMCAYIRTQIGALYDKATADAVTIQYGGSVKSGNAAEILGQENIDGVLVGGASLDPEEFAKIINR